MICLMTIEVCHQTKYVHVVVFITDMMMMAFARMRNLMISGEMNGLKMVVFGFQKVGNRLQIGILLNS